MDIYLFALIVGAVGLSAMAASGLGRHGPGASGHGHGGGHGHGHGHGHAGGHGSVASHGHLLVDGSRVAGWILMSPRFLFAALLGFGVVGVALESWIGGAVLLVAALAGGIALERLLFNPVWNFALRFASNPATTLEAAMMSEAVAVSNFDKNGQGMIAVEVDGQVQQVLATLQRADRDAGVRVRSGQKLRIEEVDAARQRCLVSML